MRTSLQKKIRPSKKNKWGIALFVLMTAIVAMSLGFKELLQMSSTSAFQAQNAIDRIQALMLARSALAAERFIITFDRALMDSPLEKDKQSFDALTDMWAQPFPFPIPIELIQGGGGGSSGSEGKDAPKAETPENTSEELTAVEKSDKESRQKKCSDFYSNFTGHSEVHTTDLSSRLSLNGLANTGNQDALLSLIQLLSPTPEFVQHLSSVGLTPETLARQIRDFMDSDEQENENKSPESSPYSAARLDYGPKNRAYQILDELKLVPGVDDEIFDWLSNKVNPTYISAINAKNRVNLNTTSKEVFQSLLKNVNNPEEIAEHFIKDRKEKQRVYTEQNLENLLKEVLGLDPKENIRFSLLTGSSEAFKIRVESTVNRTTVFLDAVVSRLEGLKKVEPLVQVRVSP